MAWIELRPRLRKTRNICSRSASTGNAAGTSLSQTMRSSAGSPTVAPTSSTSSLSAKATRRGGGSSALPKSRVRPHRLMARSMESIRVGVRWRTSGSALPARRSDTICAVARMLRRSWLILLTAVPSAARRSFCLSAARRSACIWANSRWATPISSLRPEGVTSLEASSGALWKAIMLSVMRRMGRTIKSCRLR